REKPLARLQGGRGTPDAGRDAPRESLGTQQQEFKPSSLTRSSSRKEIQKQEQGRRTERTQRKNASKDRQPPCHRRDSSRSESDTSRRLYKDRLREPAGLRYPGRSVRHRISG